jgi:hypothetical protein
VILMNLGMYVAAPAIIIFKTRKYIKIWKKLFKYGKSQLV